MNIPQEFSFTDYEIIMTWDCNLSCAYCYEKLPPKLSAPSPVNNQTTFSSENIKKLVNFILASQDKSSPEIRLNFFGGEPFFYFDTLKKIINEIKSGFSKAAPERKINFNATTNLTTLDKRQLDYLVENNFGLLVSLDGDRENHEKNRGQDTFYKVLNNLAYLYAKGLRPQLRMTITRNSLADFKKNFEFVNLLDFDFWWYLDSSVDYSTAELKQLLDDLHNLYAKPRRLRDQTLQKYLARKNQRGHCIDPYKTISVRYDGQLVICSRTNWVIGDLEKGLTELETIKNLPLYSGIPKDQCKNCLSYCFCKGGCLGEHLNHYGQAKLDYPIDHNVCKISHLLNIFVQENKILSLV